MSNGHWFRLLRYSHIFSSAIGEVLERRLLAQLSPGLSVSQLHVLKLITLNGAQPVGHMAQVLGVTPPAATRIIDKLEHAGLLERHGSQADRRVTLLRASDAGARLVESYERLKTLRLDPIMERFSDADLERLAELLERFSVLLLQLDPGEDEFCLRCAAYADEHCPLSEVKHNCSYQRLRRPQASLPTVEAIP
jgi:DNA-binding MarR family transcriptional regulator